MSNRQTPPNARAEREKNRRQTQEFQSLTAAIKADPHHPKTWITRSHWCAAEEYKELAAGDAYKTALLLEEEARNPGVFEDCKLTDADKCYITDGIVQAYLNVGALRDALLFVSDELRNPFCGYVSARMKGEVYDSKYASMNFVTRCRYPWMSPVHSRRANIHPYMERINRFLRTRGLCLQTSSVCENADARGLFATRAFRKGVRIFEDATVTSTFRETGDDDDDGTEHLLKYWIQRFVREDGANDESMELLGHEWIWPLSTTYGIQDTFSFEKHIVDVQKCLVNEGVSFDDLRYDWWILFTVLWRLGSNCYTHPSYNKEDHTDIGMAKHYTFLNHSCEPNAKWELQYSGTEIHVIALRNISRNEEILISYLDLTDESFTDSRERQKALRDWFGTDCKCTRCVREWREPVIRLRKEYGEDVEMTDVEESEEEASN